MRGLCFIGFESARCRALTVGLREDKTCYDFGDRVECAIIVFSAKKD